MKRYLLMGLSLIAVGIGAGFFIYQGQSSALENSDLKVTSWKLSTSPLPSPPGVALYSLGRGEVTTVNKGERPFYVTKLLVSVDNRLADGVPYREGFKGKHLFDVEESVEEKVIEDLNEENVSEISATLGKSLEERGYPFSRDILVSVEAKYKHWCLKDRSSEYSYEVYYEEGVLSVYEMPDKKILVKPGEENSIKMYFIDYVDGAYSGDIVFRYELENFSPQEIQQDERRVQLKLLAKTPENGTLVATETGTIRPAESGFQSVSEGDN